MTEKVYDDRNRGALWVNDRKRPDKQDADLTGSALIILHGDSVPHWFQAWENNPQPGDRRPDYGLSVKAKSGGKYWSGGLWRNEQRPGKKDPHFTGSITIDGEDFWVSAWLNDLEQNPNRAVLSVQFRMKVVPGQSIPGVELNKPKVEDPVELLDDDIPF